jgi:hypothetical protein
MGIGLVIMVSPVPAVLGGLLGFLVETLFQKHQQRANLTNNS